MSASPALSTNRVLTAEKYVLTYIFLRDVLGKGLFHIIDAWSLQTAVHDDGDTCSSVGRVDADDFLIIGSITSFLFWATVLTLDASFAIYTLVHRCGGKRSRKPRWFDAFFCGADFHDADNLETIRGQHNIFGVESIANVFLSAMAISVYLEMNEECRFGRLGITTLCWALIKLVYVSVICYYYFSGRSRKA